MVTWAILWQQRNLDVFEVSHISNDREFQHTAVDHVTATLKEELQNLLETRARQTTRLKHTIAVCSAVVQLVMQGILFCKQGFVLQAGFRSANRISFCKQGGAFHNAQHLYMLQKKSAATGCYAFKGPICIRTTRG